MRFRLHGDMELYQYQDSHQAQHIYDAPRQASSMTDRDTAEAGCSSAQDCEAERGRPTGASSEKQLYVNISQPEVTGMIVYLSRKSPDCYDNA